MCTRQSRKVTWGMINTLLLTLQLSNLLLLLSFSICKHTSMASRAIVSNFFEEQWTQNRPQYLSGLSRALFPTTFLEIAVYDHMLQEGARVEDQSTSIHNFSLLLINKRQIYFFFSIIIYSNDTAPFFASWKKKNEKLLDSGKCWKHWEKSAHL